MGDSSSFEQLISTVDLLVELVEPFESNFWIKRLKFERAKWNELKDVSPEWLLSWYGGAGSLADYTISEKLCAGQTHCTSLNKELSALQQRLWQILHSINNGTPSLGKTYHGNEALELVKKLRLIITKVGEWEKFYFDPITNEEWILDYPDSGQHGGGSPRLRLLAHPTHRNP